MSPGCSSKGKSEDASQASTSVGSGIPRFPSNFLPGNDATGTQGLSTREGLNPDPGGASNSQAPEPEPSSPATGGTSSSEPTPTLPDPGGQTTTGEESKPQPEPEPEPQPQPGEVAFVDWTMFFVAKIDDGTVERSGRRETPAGEHQLTRLGYERVLGYEGKNGSITRNTCAIFDVSQVSNAVGAKLELYLFAPSLLSVNYGDYKSPDPEEIVEIHSLDRFTPEEILDAPFQDIANHELDPLIVEDLQDGRLYGSFTMRPSMLAVDKISPSPTAIERHSKCEDESATSQRACGRWLTIELSPEAVADINAGKGLWAMGFHMSSITHANATKHTREFLFFGPHFDTYEGHENLMPSHIRPKPRLIIESKAALSK